MPLYPLLQVQEKILLVYVHAAFTVTLCQCILLVLIRVYSSVEPKFCDRYSLFVKYIDTLSNEFTRFEQPTAALV